MLVSLCVLFTHETILSGWSVVLVKMGSNTCLVEVDEVGQGGVSVLVHAQEAVVVARGVDEEVLEADGRAVGERVAPDALAHAHQEAALAGVHQQSL